MTTPSSIPTPDAPAAAASERLVRRPRHIARRNSIVRPPQPHLYVGIVSVWVFVLAWFHPRLASLLDLAHTPMSWLAVAFFVVFVEIAWLYGLYNVGVVVMAAWYQARRKGTVTPPPLPSPPPAVALLYTTYNDFVEASAESCVRQQYEHFHVYLLDDSTDEASQAQVDAFAARYPDRVSVVRRDDRTGFKAGNLNHALTNIAIAEPYFALVDADEVLPTDFLARMVPLLAADPACGFVQANHRANPNTIGALPRALGIGIDVHWRWYQPLRNRYGFVMLLGHGAVVRREAWETVGGFPHLVSEDLAFAIRLREHGWRGYFAEDVVCYEDFPPTVRAFRVRHMKWTRGTSEFLTKDAGRLLRAPQITLVEKLDVLFPTLGLPLSLFWFLYLIDANLVLGSLFGIARPITLSVGTANIVLPMWGLNEGFNAIYSMDFVCITLLTFFAPMLAFVIDLGSRPRTLLTFLSKSTVLYASLGPLSFVGVLSYVLTRRAKFFVTGDLAAPSVRGQTLTQSVRQLIQDPHPAQRLLQGFEFLTGLVFVAASFAFFQPASLGLALGFLLLPTLHHVAWDHPVMRRLIHLPFALIIGGLLLGVGSLLGMQTVFFGYGFHF